MSMNPLVELVDVNAQRYSGIAAISLVIYDIMITLDKEIQHFWGRSFSLVQLIYFLNRYYGLLVVGVYLYGDMLQDFPHDLCEGIVKFSAWSGWTMLLLADAIMVIRVIALFDRTKLVTFFLGSLYFAQGLAMMGILIGYDRWFDDYTWDDLPACGVFAPSWFSVFWIPTLIFEFLLLSMTLYKSYNNTNTVISGGVGVIRRYSLYRILVRDQVIYFASILLSGCVNIALWKQLSHRPNNEGITLSVAIPCVLGGRILMSLREAAIQQGEQFDETGRSTSLDFEVVRLSSIRDN